MTETFETMLAERRQASRELEERAEHAKRLASAVASMKEDLVRIERRRAKFLDLGDRHVEIPQKSLDQRYGCVIAWEPIRSIKTGSQLAAGLDQDVDHLKGQIAANEAQIEELLAR